MACVLLAWPACLPRADEVYKSIDAQGHVVYSDRPDSSAHKAVVNVDRPDPKEVADRQGAGDPEGRGNSAQSAKS